MGPKPELGGLGDVSVLCAIATCGNVGGAPGEESKPELGNVGGKGEGADGAECAAPRTGTSGLGTKPELGKGGRVET